jgi:hypothetical protein
MSSEKQSFRPDVVPERGYYGAIVPCGPVDVFSGNVWDDTGAGAVILSRPAGGTSLL